MNAIEIGELVEKGTTIMWIPPSSYYYDTRKDYRITSIDIGEDTSHISYNNGKCFDFVHNIHITIAPEVISKKQFKEHCHDTVYIGRTRINALFFGYKDRRWRYMVWSPVKLITKKELFDEFYNWVIHHKALSDCVKYKIARTENDMFQIPITL
jgi:hypothetical protein